jgi:putative colanic acid biosynthesis acetyltransferase WcaF
MIAQELNNFTPTLKVGASKTKYILWMLMSIIFFKSSIPYPSSLKKKLLKFFGARIGNGVVFKPSINIKFPWKLTIGNYCWIGENVWIDNLAEVVIEDNVCISQGAFLLTGNHNYKKKTFDLVTGNIILKSGVWIGAKTIVCPNVICYENSILSVGSIATKSLQANTIYGGNPAIEIRKRTAII